MLEERALLIIELEKHLEKKLHQLKGSWVKKNSHYDGSICQVLDMQEDTNRYWDASWKNMHIEFKKGNSIWLDLIRYGEILLGVNEQATKETFSLFFIPNKDKTLIVEIMGVETKKIITKLGITKEISKSLIALKNNLPRSLNAQASLTKKDIREIADFVLISQNLLK
ncbi:MAG: hypothetical protein HN916_05690 [Anaerolineae bacterium]|jgi:hypothetical protein|nr:hypothetical protein [Anaerolineae bacterium]